MARAFSTVPEKAIDDATGYAAESGEAGRAGPSTAGVGVPAGAVQAAAVVARPDEKWGETPCAFVELKPGQSATQDEIIAWCKTLLASFKCPRTVVFVEVPKTSTGKIQKFKLREMARAL